MVGVVQFALGQLYFLLELFNTPRCQYCTEMSECQIYVETENLEYRSIHARNQHICEKKNYTYFTVVMLLTIRFPSACSTEFSLILPTDVFVGDSRRHLIGGSLETTSAFCAQILGMWQGLRDAISCSVNIDAVTLIKPV